MKLLIDTNVIVDYLGRKPPFFADAERIMAAGYFGDAELWASTQSFKDAFFILSHYVDSSRLQDAIAHLLEIVHPVDLTGADVISATQLKWPDLEDCLIALSAQKAKADYLVTRDRKGFERSAVPAASPAEWLDLMRADERITYDAIEL